MTGVNSLLGVGIGSVAGPQTSEGKDGSRCSYCIDTLCIELTVKCPLRCIHCSANAAPERRIFQDVDVLAKCLRELNLLSEIYLSGGEPFEHPDIEQIVEVSARAARLVVAYSSGVLLNDSGIASVSSAKLRRLKAKGLSRVDVSLYAADPDSHDSVTLTNGSFQATLLTAKRIRESGLALGVHFVPIGSTSERVLDVYQLSKTLGAVRFHVLALTGQGRAKQRLARLAPTQHFWRLMSTLADDHDGGQELLLSSQLRRQIDRPELTRRDSLATGFLDVHGFLYPGEGQQSARLRSSTSIYSGATLVDLIKEVGNLSA